MPSETDLYQDNGFHSRRHYLQSLSQEYGVPYNEVIALAQLLGKDEDFDGLPTMLSDRESELL